MLPFLLSCQCNKCSLDARVYSEIRSRSECNNRLGIVYEVKLPSSKKKKTPSEKQGGESATLEIKFLFTSFQMNDLIKRMQSITKLYYLIILMLAEEK